MSGINLSSLLNVSSFNGANTDLAIKPNGTSSQNLKLEFDPAQLGYPDPRKRPSELRLTDRQIERQALKQLGLDISSSENLALVNKRLKTDNPFQALRTEGSNLATYNADTGKYERKLKIDGKLYARLKGWAENTKAEIAAAKPEQNNSTIQTAAPKAVTDNQSVATIKVFVPLVKAEGDQSLGESALLSYVSDRYDHEKTGLFGENVINIRNAAKNAGVKALKPETEPVGNKQWVRLEISLPDAKRIDDIFKAERAAVNRQTDVVDETGRNSAGNKFVEGFMRGAWNDLKGNAEMVYGAATDPLGTIWKVGEAIAQIPVLPTKIAVGIGQAAVELSQLTPEQRQGLIDELIVKGHKELLDLPVSVAAEKAGEIVGTMAMEAVLAKGAGVALKGLESLKGTAFLGKIETLAQTAKTNDCCR